MFIYHEHTNKNHKLVKAVLKKQALAALILIATACFSLGFTGYGEQTQPDVISTPDEIMLSWTGNPASTVTVSWRGDSEYQGVVLCNGKRFSAESTEVVDGEYYRYTGEITGLLPGQSYEYKVGDGNTWSKTHRFTTEKKGAFSFMYMGDIQYENMQQDYQSWGNLIDEAYQKNPATAFLLLGGDLVVDNSEIAEYEAVLDQGQPMFASVPVMTTPGNHETNVTPDRYKQLFALPQNGTNQTKEEIYSFDYGNCHIVSLNSNLFRPERIASMGQDKWNAMMKEVETWIKDDLSAHEGDFIVVFMHHPPYPISVNLDIYGLVEKAWVPLFEKYGVDVVFVGHQHIYMRTKSIDGVTYIMARSGEKYSRYYEKGDPIPKYVKTLAEENTYEVVNVTKDTLEVVAYDKDGKAIDRWTTEK
jgi:hypothetical protein